MKMWKYCLQRVLTVEAFIKGLNDRFKVPPKCIERVQYCFDYSILDEAFDNQFARFNLHEKTGDKCHYFVLWMTRKKGLFFSTNCTGIQMLYILECIWKGRSMCLKELDWEKFCLQNL